MQVIAKYELIDIGQVSVNVDRSGGCEVLELNVVLAPTKPEPPDKEARDKKSLTAAAAT